MKTPKKKINVAESLISNRKRKAVDIPSEEPNMRRMTMTVEEMGKELGVSRSIAYELSKQPGFPAFSIGRRTLVSRDGLEKWIETQCQSGRSVILQPIEK